MRFLADENLPLMLVQMLANEGHDVVRASEYGATDERVLQNAEADRRLLLTFDKDFGELVFLRHLSAVGVILIRLPGMTIAQRTEHLRKVLPILEREAPGHFVVVTEDRIRLKRLH